eukprot:TRINITY_DN2936_c0_g1_i3.p1 TRINITY_DN2936_c0_g1~~TRINITY_DN2936_c0_g1_i3.p1  ORF type:complete len:1043 (+),score=305.11 TRINITY_DN2936_c0_g1_i3:160-3288(+)
MSEFDRLVALVGGLGDWSQQGNRGIYYKHEECLGCLKHLIRYVKRESMSESKDVMKQLGSWNIVSKDLLPLLISYSNVEFFSLHFEICKLLNLLTLAPDPKSHDIAIQLEYLQNYKAAFIESEDGMAALISILSECVQKKKRQRTPEEGKLIELILTLIKNLLSIADQQEQPGSANYHKTQLHSRFIGKLSEEQFFPLFFIMLEQSSNGDHKSFVFLFAEILLSLFKREKAVDLVQSHLQSKQSKPSQGLISQLMRKEKIRMNGSVTKTTEMIKSGTFIVRDGKHHTITSKSGASIVKEEPTSLKKKGPVGRGRPKKADFNEILLSHFSPSSPEAKVILKEFADKFLSLKCYNVLIFQMQKAFTSYQETHLEEDQRNYLLIMRFFNGYFLAQHCLENQPLGKDLDISLITESYNYEVLKKIVDYVTIYREEKNYKSLAVAVALLKENFQILRTLSKSKNESDQTLASKIHQRISYYEPVMDNIKWMIRSYNESTLPRSFLSDLIEIIHVLSSMVVSFGALVQKKKKKVRVATKAQKKTSNEDEEQESEERKKEEEKQGNDDKENEEEKENEPDEETRKFIEELDRQQKVQMEKLEKLSKGETDEPIQDLDKTEREIEDHTLEDGEDSDDEMLTRRSQARVEKIISLEEFFSQFAFASIIRNYMVLYSEFNANSIQLNHFIATMIKNIVTHTSFQPMFYQVSVLFQFSRLLNDKSAHNKVECKELIDVTRKIVDDFLSLLRKSPDLSFKTFAWKTRGECSLLSSSQNSEFIRRKANKTIKWNVDEDNHLKELWETNKHSDVRFELISNQMVDDAKNDISVIYLRLIHLGLVSERDTLPDGLSSQDLFGEEEDSQNSFGREDESEEDIIILQSLEEISAIEGAYQFLKEEIETALQFHGTNEDQTATVDHIVIPSENVIRLTNEASVINAMNLLGFKHVQEDDSSNSNWTIPASVVTHTLQSNLKKIESLLKKETFHIAKEIEEQENEIDLDLSDKENDPPKVAENELVPNKKLKRRQIESSLSESEDELVIVKKKKKALSIAN